MKSVIWKCDGCDLEEKSETPPSGWYTVKLKATFEGHNGASARGLNHTHKADLCGQCAESAAKKIDPSEWRNAVARVPANRRAGSIQGTG